MHLKFQLVVISVINLLINLTTTTTTTISSPLILQNYGSPTKPEIWLSDYYFGIWSKTQNYDKVQLNRSLTEHLNFQDNHIHRNGSDYVVLNWVHGVSFTCRATYPVEWTIPHKSQLEGISHRTFQLETTRISDFTANQPTSKYFETKVSVTTRRNFLSLNLTCAGVQSKYVSLSSSVHLYNAASDFEIEMQEKTILVNVSTDEGTGEVILPCRPAIPNLTVRLEKLVETIDNISKDGQNAKHSKTWIQLNASVDYEDFDPKVGFKLRKSGHEMESLVGLYRCVVEAPPVVEEDGGVNGNSTLEEERSGSEVESTTGELNSDHETELTTEENVTENGNENETEEESNAEDLPDGSFVYVNVTLSDSAVQEKKFTRTIDLHGNASVAISQTRFIDPIPEPAATQIICCSGIANRPPTLAFERCDNRMQCDLLLSMMERVTPKQSDENEFYNAWVNERNSKDKLQGCARADMIYNAVVLCNGESMNVSEFYTNVFQTGITPISTRTGIVAQNRESGKNVAMRLQQYKPVAEVEESTKAILTVGHHITEKDYTENRHRKYLQFNQQNYYESYDRLVYLPKRNTAVKPEFVAEYPRDFYYEQESLIGICLGWRFYHDEGARISIRWKNGSRTVIDQEQEMLKTKPNLMYFGNGVTTRFVDDGELIHTFGKNVKAHKDMAAMECWLPKIKSEGWSLVTKEFTIVEAIAPKIAKPPISNKVEVVQLYLGENLEQHVDCEVVKGAPEPRVVVTKEGKWVIGKFDGNDEDLANNFNVTITSNAAKASNVEGGGITARINFGKATMDLEGIYQCVAENQKGRDTRSFQVIVGERKK